MVKSYLRYEESAAFGVVVSSEANVEYDSSGKLLLAGALEQVAVWNIKQSRSVQNLVPPAANASARAAVTSLHRMPTSTTLVAAGYADGFIRIWDIVRGMCETTLVGHKGAITALRYNKSGSLLASGSKDTDIVVWDVVGESGLFSLRGHRDQVTDVVFLMVGKRLISSSKDTFVRVWDLDTQSCIQVVVGHRGEIWSIDLNGSENYFVTGSSDQELHLYAVNSNEEGENENVEEKKAGKWQVLNEIGTIKRSSNERVVTVRFDESGTLLGSQVAGKVLELYSVSDHAEALRKMKRRKKRKKEKAAKVSEKHGTEARVQEEQAVESDQIIASDILHLTQSIRVKHKIRSFAFSPLQPKKGTLGTLAVALHNNSLEVYEIQEKTASRLYVVDLPGHRSDVRVARLSQDSTLLMTASHNAVKIWNPQTSACLRTVETGYGLSGVFAPSNRHVVLGTKGGTLEIVDFGAAERSKIIEAHTGAVWSISPFMDGSGFVSGSADHDVKFWEYEVDKATNKLNILNTRTLRMAEDVLAVCLSADAKYLAVSLLDSTVKIFFVDSLKFFLSLYGHKLPALGMDISSDGRLLATGSADKNVKIWGMDFGDCHKSLFAHADSVMSVCFVPNTHYLFSVGKDRMVKYWDADTFELLLSLEGHHAEAWCLAVSSHGDFIVTGSHDRSIRRWDRTSEPFFLEEEKEKRLEVMFESGMDEMDQASKGEIPDEGAAGVAGRKTQDTVTAVDSIIEALELAESEKERLAAHKSEESSTKVRQFKPNVLLLGMSPSAFVLRALTQVRPTDLEQAFLMLPFMDALKLMGYLKAWVSEGQQVELVCRVAVLLLQIHHEQLASTVAARPVLTSLHLALKEGVQTLKNVLGFNLAAMGHLKVDAILACLSLVTVTEQRLLIARADMPFKDAALKVIEIRKQLAKRKGAPEPGTKLREKKKKKVKTQPEEVEVDNIIYD